MVSEVLKIQYSIVASSNNSELEEGLRQLRAVQNEISKKIMKNESTEELNNEKEILEAKLARLMPENHTKTKTTLQDNSQYYDHRPSTCRIFTV
jgi:phosphoketolase